MATARYAKLIAVVVFVCVGINIFLHTKKSKSGILYLHTSFNHVSSKQDLLDVDNIHKRDEHGVPSKRESPANNPGSALQNKVGEPNRDAPTRQSRFDFDNVYDKKEQHVESARKQIFEQEKILSFQQDHNRALPSSLQQEHKNKELQKENQKFVQASPTLASPHSSSSEKFSKGVHSLSSSVEKKQDKQQDKYQHQSLSTSRLVSNQQGLAKGPIETQISDSNTCKPKSKIVYVKTHKTGSSTLTNIFHRFAHKHNLKAVLPKSNTFLGWPRSAGIPTSYVSLPGVEGNYDIFCSAHTRYSRKYIEKIVPNADYITIFREPTSHFKSSWSYWDVPGHIQRVSGMTVTMEQFLEDPETWFPRGLKGDRDLLHNSFAFDFGFDHTYTEDQVDDLISHLDTFALVLITEYMDASLVLLKRKLCWELEDVVYFALKVNKHKPRTVIASEVREKILKLNWVDAKLYHHFNESLWRQIAAEPNFQEELDEFKRLKDQLSTQCEPWAKWNEDEHRKALLEEDGKPLPEKERVCHLAQMDSVGFVKFLKLRSGVPDLECNTQGRPKQKIVYVKTHKTGSSTVTNILHRYTHKHNLRPVLPKNNLFLGYPNKASLPSSYVKLPPIRGKDEYDVLCSAHSVYDRPRMDALVPDASYITVLRDPTSHFVSSWNYWHVTDHIKSRSGKEVSMFDFIENPNKYRTLLSEGDHRLIHNSMVHDLGLSGSPSRADVEQLVSELNNRFALVIITEHFDESLIMLRRQLCWKPEEILYLSLKVNTKAKATQKPLPGYFRSQVEAYNWADARLFHALNMTLWYRINHAIGFRSEMQWLKQEKERLAELCQQFSGWGDDLHRKALLEQHISEEDEQCHLLMMDSPGFVKLLKDKFGKADPECHNQPKERSSLVFSSVGQTPEGHAVGALLFRFGVAKVVPKSDELSFGWPLVRTYEELSTRLQMTKPVNGFRPFPVVVGQDVPLDAQVMSRIAVNPHFVVLVANPLNTLVAVWREHNFSHKLREFNSKTVSLQTYLQNPDSFSSILSKEHLQLLKNPLAYLLGYDGDESTASVHKFLRGFLQRVKTVLIAEHLYESVVHLRRVFCLSSDKWIFKPPTQIEKDTTVVDETSPLSLREMNELANLHSHADRMLYDSLNNTFFRRLRREVGLSVEIDQLKRRASSFAKDCEYVHSPAFSDNQDFVDRLLPSSNNDLSKSQRECLFSGLSLANLFDLSRKHSSNSK
eukprot:gene2803-5646_t